MISFERVLQAIDSHTEGDPTRLVTGGLPRVPGATMVDKREWLRAHCDELRTALVHEPRGHDAIVVAFLTEAVSAGADVGVVFANDAGWLGMCGHGAIGVASALAALGTIPVREPETPFVLDTPAGVVQARVRVASGRPHSVVLQNVPSFVHALDVIVPVEGRGKVRADIAYGGNWFAFVDDEQLGIEVVPANLEPLMQAALAIRAGLAAAGIRGRDPRTSVDAPIDHVKIGRHRALTLCPGRAYDRSPCGTGTSAKLAVLHARGKLGVGVDFVYESILGTRFVARILGTTEVAGRAAVLPQIEGRAFVTGLQQFVLDADDPLRHGFRLGG